MYEQMAGQPLSDETHPAPWSLILPATPDKTGQARRFLAAVLNGCALADDAVACLGELAINAVIHSDSRLPGGTFSVRVQTRPGKLRVEVHDSGGPWAPRRTSGNGASGGRGLLIVSQLADRWGVTPTATAPHRTVWFEIDLPSPPVLPEGEPAMPDTSHPASRAGEEAAWWLEDIAGHLTAADLPARLHHTPHSTYLTATTGTRTGTGTGTGEIEATIDDDSYCEIRFWLAAGATPAQAAAVVTRAITAITS